MNLNKGQTDSNFLFTALDGLKDVQISLYEHALSLASIVDFVISDSLEALEGLYRELEEGGPREMKKLVMPPRTPQPGLNLSALWGLLAFMDNLNKTSLYITALAFLMTVSLYASFTTLYRRYQTKRHLAKMYQAYKVTTTATAEDLLRKPSLIECSLQKLQLAQKILPSQRTDLMVKPSVVNASSQVSYPWTESNTDLRTSVREWTPDWTHNSSIALSTTTFVSTTRAEPVKQTERSKSLAKREGNRAAGSQAHAKGSSRQARWVDKRWVSQNDAPELNYVQHNGYTAASPRQHINKNFHRHKSRPEVVDGVRTRWNGGSRKRQPTHAVTSRKRPSGTSATKTPHGQGSARADPVTKRGGGEKRRRTLGDKRVTSTGHNLSPTDALPTDLVGHGNHIRSKKTPQSAQKPTSAGQCIGLSARSDDSCGGVNSNPTSHNQNRAVKANWPAESSVADTKQKDNLRPMKNPKKIKRVKSSVHRGRDNTAKNKNPRKRRVRKPKSSAHTTEGLKDFKVANTDNEDISQVSYLLNSQGYALLSAAETIKPTPFSALSLNLDSESFPIKRTTVPVLNSLKGQGAFKSYTRQHWNVTARMALKDTPRPTSRGGRDTVGSDHSKKSAVLETSHGSISDYGLPCSSLALNTDSACITDRDTLTLEFTMGNTGRHNTKFLRAKSQLFPNGGLDMAPVQVHPPRQLSCNHTGMDTVPSETQQQTYRNLKGQNAQKYHDLKQKEHSIVDLVNSQTEAFLSKGKVSSSLIPNLQSNKGPARSAHKLEGLANTDTSHDATSANNANRYPLCKMADEGNKDTKLPGHTNYQLHQPQPQFISSSRLLENAKMPVPKPGQNSSLWKKHDSQPVKCTKLLDRQDLFKIATDNRSRKLPMESHGPQVQKQFNELMGKPVPKEPDSRYVQAPAFKDKQVKGQNAQEKQTISRRANEIQKKDADRQDALDLANEKFRTTGGETNRSNTQRWLSECQQKSPKQKHEVPFGHRLGNGSLRDGSSKEWSKQNDNDQQNTQKTSEKECVYKSACENPFTRTKKELYRPHAHEMAEDSLRLTSKEPERQTVYKLRKEGDQIIQEHRCIKPIHSENPNHTCHTHMGSEDQQFTRHSQHTRRVTSSQPFLDKNKTDRSGDKATFEQNLHESKINKKEETFNAGMTGTAYKPCSATGVSDDTHGYQWETQPDCTEENTVFKVTKNKITTVRSNTGNDQPSAEPRELQTRKALIHKATELHNEPSNFQISKKTQPGSGGHSTHPGSGGHSTHPGSGGHSTHPGSSGHVTHPGSGGNFLTNLLMKYSQLTSRDTSSHSENTRHDQSVCEKSCPDNSGKKSGLGHLQHPSHNVHIDKGNSSSQEWTRQVSAHPPKSHELADSVAINACKEHRRVEGNLPEAQEGGDCVTKYKIFQSNPGLEFGKRGNQRHLSIVSHHDYEVVEEEAETGQKRPCVQESTVHRLHRKHCPPCHQQAARHDKDAATDHSDTGTNRRSKPEKRTGLAAYKPSLQETYLVRRSKSLISVGQMLSELTASSRSRSGLSPASKSKALKTGHSRACKVIYFTPPLARKRPKYRNDRLCKAQEKVKAAHSPKKADARETTSNPHLWTGKADYIRYYKLKKFKSHRHEPYKRHLNLSSDSTSVSSPGDQYKYLIRNKNNCSPSRRGRYVLGPLLDKQCFAQDGERQLRVELADNPGYNFGHGSDTESRNFAGGEADRPQSQAPQTALSQPVGHHHGQNEVIAVKQSPGTTELTRSQPPETASPPHLSSPRHRNRPVDACKTSRWTAQHDEGSMPGFHMMKEIPGFAKNTQAFTIPQRNSKLKQEGDSLSQSRLSQRCQDNQMSKFFNKKETPSANRTSANSRHEAIEQHKPCAHDEEESRQCQIAHTSTQPHTRSETERALTDTQITSTRYPHQQDSLNSLGSCSGSGQITRRVKSPSIVKHQVRMIKKQLFLAHMPKILKPHRLKKSSAFDKSSYHLRGKKAYTDIASMIDRASRPHQQDRRAIKYFSPAMDSHMTQTDHSAHSVHVAVQTSPNLDGSCDSSGLDKRKEWKGNTVCKLTRDKHRIVKGSRLMKPHRAKPTCKDSGRGGGVGDCKLPSHVPNRRSYNLEPQGNLGTALANKMPHTLQARTNDATAECEGTLTQNRNDQLTPLRENIECGQETVQTQDKLAAGATSAAVGGSRQTALPEKQLPVAAAGIEQNEQLRYVLRFSQKAEQSKGSQQASQDRVCVTGSERATEAGEPLTNWPSSQQWPDTLSTSQPLPRKGTDGHQVLEEGTLGGIDTDKHNQHSNERELPTADDNLSITTESLFNGSAAEARDVKNSYDLPSRLAELRKLCVIRPLWKNANVDEIDRRVKRALRLREELQMSKSAREPSRGHFGSCNKSSEPDTREGGTASKNELPRDTPRTETTQANGPGNSEVYSEKVHPFLSKGRPETQQSYHKDQSQISRKTESKELTVPTPNMAHQTDNENRQIEVKKGAGISSHYHGDETATCSKAYTSGSKNQPENCAPSVRREGTFRVERSLSFHEESVSEVTSRPRRPSSARPCAHTSHSQNANLKRTREQDKNSPPTKISKVENVTPGAPRLVEPLVQCLPQVPLASFVEWFIETSDPKNFISSDRSSTSSDKPLDLTPNQSDEIIGREQHDQIPWPSTGTGLCTDDAGTSANQPEWRLPSPHTPWPFSETPKLPFASRYPQDVPAKPLTMSVHHLTTNSSTFLDTPSSLTYAMSTITSESTRVSAAEQSAKQQSLPGAVFSGNKTPSSSKYGQQSKIHPLTTSGVRDMTGPRDIPPGENPRYDAEPGQHLQGESLKHIFDRQLFISFNKEDTSAVEERRNAASVLESDLNRKESLAHLKYVRDPLTFTFNSSGESKRRDSSFNEALSPAATADQKGFSMERITTEDTDHLSSKSDDYENIRINAVRLTKDSAQSYDPVGGAYRGRLLAGQLQKRGQTDQGQGGVDQLDLQEVEEGEGAAGNRCGPGIRHILMKLQHNNDTEDQTATWSDRTRITLRKSSDVTGIIAKFQNDSS